MIDFIIEMASISEKDVSVEDLYTNPEEPVLETPKKGRSARKKASPKSAGKRPTKKKVTSKSRAKTKSK